MHLLPLEQAGAVVDFAAMRHELLAEASLLHHAVDAHGLFQPSTFDASSIAQDHDLIAG